MFIWHHLTLVQFPLPVPVTFLSTSHLFGCKTTWPSQHSQDACHHNIPASCRRRTTSSFEMWICWSTWQRMTSAHCVRFFSVFPIRNFRSARVSQRSADTCRTLHVHEPWVNFIMASEKHCKLYSSQWSILGTFSRNRREVRVVAPTPNTPKSDKAVADLDNIARACSVP